MFSKVKTTQKNHTQRHILSSHFPSTSSPSLHLLKYQILLFTDILAISFYKDKLIFSFLHKNQNMNYFLCTLLLTVNIT